MKISVLINGAFGKMGMITAQAISEDENFELVGQTGRGYDLAAAIIDSKAQVVIDLTNAESVYQNSKIIIEAGVHPVIGTSGLVAEQISQLEKICEQRQLGGIIAPNFSIGALLMNRFAVEAVKYLPQVEIIEYHHDKKLDSPSGTAIRSAAILAAARGDYSKMSAHKEIVAGARGANYQEIPIHAVRLPGLLAHQDIIFGAEGETLTLRHDSIDRKCFMPGIKLACKKVIALKTLVYGLEQLLV